MALERTTVRAPWAASVIDANAVEGQVLGVGEKVATLLPLDYAVVELQVPIKTLRVLETGIARIELRPVDDLAAPSVMGTFERTVKSLTDDTRLATIRVRVDRPLDRPGWAFGMYLQATIVTKKQLAVALVPPDLIVSGNSLWIYRDGKAIRHQVHPIEELGSLISIEDNFLADDAILVERPIGLFDGASVDAVGP